MRCSKVRLSPVQLLRVSRSWCTPFRPRQWWCMHDSGRPSQVLTPASSAEGLPSRLPHPSQIRRGPRSRGPGRGPVAGQEQLFPSRKLLLTVVLGKVLGLKPPQRATLWPSTLSGEEEGPFALTREQKFINWALQRVNMTRPRDAFCIALSPSLPLSLSHSSCAPVNHLSTAQSPPARLHVPIV